VTIKKLSKRPYTPVFIEHLKWLFVINVEFGEDARNCRGINVIFLEQTTSK
jgi:hypothetical protein